MCSGGGCEPGRVTALQGGVKPVNKWCSAVSEGPKGKGVLVCGAVIMPVDFTAKASPLNDFQAHACVRVCGGSTQVKHRLTGSTTEEQYS